MISIIQLQDSALKISHFEVEMEKPIHLKDEWVCAVVVEFPASRVL